MVVSLAVRHGLPSWRSPADQDRHSGRWSRHSGDRSRGLGEVTSFNLKPSAPSQVVGNDSRPGGRDRHREVREVDRSRLHVPSGSGRCSSPGWPGAPRSRHVLPGVWLPAAGEPSLLPVVRIPAPARAPAAAQGDPTLPRRPDPSGGSPRAGVAGQPVPGRGRGHKRQMAPHGWSGSTRDPRSGAARIPRQR